MAVKVYTLGDVTVTTAGTRVQVTATATPITSIIVQSKATNTGKIFVGDSDVSSTRGISLAPGETIAISADLSGRPGGDEFIFSDFYIDSSVNAEIAKVMYIKRR